MLLFFIRSKGRCHSLVWRPYCKTYGSCGRWHNRSDSPAARIKSHLLTSASHLLSVARKGPPAQICLDPEPPSQGCQFGILFACVSTSVWPRRCSCLAHFLWSSPICAPIWSLKVRIATKLGPSRASPDTDKAIYQGGGECARPPLGLEVKLWQGVMRINHFCCILCTPRACAKGARNSCRRWGNPCRWSRRGRRHQRCKINACTRVLDNFPQLLLRVKAQ